MNALSGIIAESVFLLNKMSPYLLFGFLVAGIFHIFVKEGMIARHLGQNSVGSVVKASLFGIPLPLCSCGVLPTAMSLRKEGASKGAVLSFLISTPTTGIDSIFATYALLGGLFAFYRVLGAFIAGVVAGILANLIFRNDALVQEEEKDGGCKACHGHDHSVSHHGAFDKARAALRYGFVDLMKDSGAWILMGIVVAGVISYYLPARVIEQYLGSPLKSMIVMFLVGIPMYVCSSGSIPVAASLMMKGLNPGAGFVFLMAGPATNSTALTVIAKELGFKVVCVFMLTIIICGLALGYFLNFLWEYWNIDFQAQIMAHGELIPLWVEQLSSVVLLGCIFLSFCVTAKVEHGAKKSH